MRRHSAPCRRSADQSVFSVPAGPGASAADRTPRSGTDENFFQNNAAEKEAAAFPAPLFLSQKEAIHMRVIKTAQEMSDILKNPIEYGKLIRFEACSLVFS